MSDAGPGITRQRVASGFVYRSAGGSALRDKAQLARIRSLAVPPAWEKVWICPQADGHLQATGREARDETKYGRMAAFARALPAIRRRVREDLARSGLPREKVLATSVRLLEVTRMRVGNEEYARENESFGPTTLRTRQVRVNGSRMEFRFRGKSGVWHRFELNDRALARIVRRMRDLPGYELFQYVDESGQTRAVDSADVNAYLQAIAGEDFTSKDFRTWGGTVLAALACHRLGYPANKRKLVQAVEEVARALGNTAAVCRKCYIHPAVLDAYADGSLAQAMTSRSVETCVHRLLRSRRRRRSLVPLLRQSLRDLRRRGTRFAAGAERRALC